MGGKSLGGTLDVKGGEKNVSALHQQLLHCITLKKSHLHKVSQSNSICAQLLFLDKANERHVRINFR